MAGAYSIDRLQTACNSPQLASGGPAGTAGYNGKAFIAGDGTVPCKAIVCCIADASGSALTQGRRAEPEIWFL